MDTLFEGKSTLDYFLVHISCHIPTAQHFLLGKQPATHTNGLPLITITSALKIAPQTLSDITIQGT